MALWRIDEEEPPLGIALHRRRTAGGRRIRRPPPPARIPGLACAVARAAARSTRGARSGRRSRISFPVTRPEYSGEHTGRAPAPANAYGPTPACTKTPDPKTFHSNTPGSATRCKRVSSPPLRHIGVSHSHGYAAVILSAQPCAVDIEPADSDFSRAARRFISPQEQALQPCALPEVLFPHWSGVQRRPYINGYG